MQRTDIAKFMEDLWHLWVQPELSPPVDFRTLAENLVINSKPTIEFGNEPLGREDAEWSLLIILTPDKAKSV